MGGGGKYYTVCWLSGTRTGRVGWGAGGQLGTTEFAGQVLGLGRGTGGELGTTVFAASRTPARGEWGGGAGGGQLGTTEFGGQLLGVS